MKYTQDLFEKLFYEADMDKNHGIEYTELHSFLKKHDMNPDLALVRDLFQKFDKDGSGKIELKEWCDMMSQLFQ
ncbi:EF-hand_domain [Hexamita inflata]|uniref:EF-hand domain n=1 Tax=Hexamita inflata TaxID=28002 RepID=A0AA86TH42_9EUKA|nr:EF-hand domain [Hexamita inflata]CAI9917057.1 EF-hand domain [Hexamita inflata]CAI9931480.1 EF-hand domain [Hexamita inflata]